MHFFKVKNPRFWDAVLPYGPNVKGAEVTHVVQHDSWPKQGMSEASPSEK
jgi:hypothetical protein